MRRPFCHIASLLRTVFWCPGWLWSLLIAGTLLVPARITHSTTIDEGKVRAAVMFHIIALTQWPALGRLAETPPRTLILGRDPGGLAAILARRFKDPVTAAGNITHITTLGAQDHPDALNKILHGCQILYLTRDGMQYLPQLLPLLSHQPILTIGETEEFCQTGNGMICLTIEQQKLVIQIHQGRAASHGFTFSAELLRHAVLLDGAVQ